MNRLEHLLTILIEECAELQQAASKAKRFGLEDGYPCTDRTNHRDMNDEFNDVLAVVDLLNFEGLHLSKSYEKIIAKKEKIEHYLKYSEQQGTLTKTG